MEEKESTGTRVCEHKYCLKRGYKKFCQIKNNATRTKNRHECGLTWERAGCHSPGSHALHQKIWRDKHLELSRSLARIRNSRNRDRWGYPSRNAYHRMRKELITQGTWKEEEHPL